jgi:hypothetical protein
VRSGPKLAVEVAGPQCGFQRCFLSHAHSLASKWAVWLFLELLRAFFQCPIGINVLALSEGLAAVAAKRTGGGRRKHTAFNG